MATRHLKRKPLNVAIQRLALQKDYPDATCETKSGLLAWTGKIQPTPLSRTYELRLVYRPPKAPRIYVVDPPLENRNGKRPPHRYKEGNLCLYLPWDNEWGPHMLLAHTIIPWASEWLMHYELWLVTGSWHGGGVHLGGSQSSDAKPEPQVP